MITKGIIKSIDRLGNTCTVHIPFFETAGNDPIIETATVSNTPGSYNGYKVGDVVYVAFEDGSMSTPVVIGKLYLGTEKEKADPRGVSNVEESTAAKKATLPADSKLAAEIDSTVPNTTVPYTSLSSIANSLNTLNTNVGQMDRDYGNRFKQVISNADGLASTIEQKADEISAKVVHKIEDRKDVEPSDILDSEGKPTGLTTKGLGWEINAQNWSIRAYDQNREGNLPADGLELFKVARDEIAINAPNVRLSGYPQSSTTRYAFGTAENYPALYKEPYQEGTNPTTDSDYMNLYIKESTQTAGLNCWTTEKLELDTIETDVGAETEPYIWQWVQTVRYDYTKEIENWAVIIDDVVTPVMTKKTLKRTRTHLRKNATATSETEAIAQGKTTNYYSPDDPADEFDPYGHGIKPGDCWFDTGIRYVQVTPTIDPAADSNGTFSTKEQYLNYFLHTGTDWTETDFTKITTELLPIIVENEAVAYKREHNCLKQWTGSTWEDIGGELVANKLTTNYINALDITAKKINVGTTFSADATSGAVEIGGFKVTPTTLYKDTAGADPAKNTITTQFANKSLYVSTTNIKGTLSGIGTEYRSEVVTEGEKDNEGNLLGTKFQPRGSLSAEDWRLTIGESFGVQSDGVLYAANAVFDGTITPSATGTGALGTPSKRWGEIYCGNLKSNGVIWSENLLYSSGNIETSGKIYATGQIATDKEIFSGGPIITYGTDDAVISGNSVLINPRTILNPSVDSSKKVVLAGGADTTSDGTIRSRGGLFLYDGGNSILGALDPADPMNVVNGGTTTSPTPKFAVDTSGNAWAQSIYFSKTTPVGDTRWYPPVVQIPGDANCLYTVLKTVKSNVTGGSVIDAQWLTVPLPAELKLKSSSTTNSRVQGVWVTGFLSTANVSWKETVDGSCGSSTTTTGTSINVGAQGQTYYVRWDWENAYVLIPSKTIISSNITSSFTIKVCVLIAGKI